MVLDKIVVDLVKTGKTAELDSVALNDFVSEEMNIVDHYEVFAMIDIAVVDNAVDKPDRYHFRW